MYFKRLKELREAKKLTQLDISRFLEMHTSQYQRYERGESPVSLELARKIAVFYDVSIDYIAGLTDNKRSWKN